LVAEHLTALSSQGEKGARNVVAKMLGIAGVGPPAFSSQRLGWILRLGFPLGRTLNRCLHPRIKSEIFILRLQVQTEESLNRLMRGNMCCLATDIKTENAASIAEIACAELKDRAAEKKRAAAGGAKSKKP
jgi:hypothetical protein